MAMPSNTADQTTWRRRRRYLPILAVLLAAVVASSCAFGGDDTSPAITEVPTTASVPRDEVFGYPSECSPSLPDGAVLSIESPAGRRSNLIYEDGSIIAFAGGDPHPLITSTGMIKTLTLDGVRLLLDRILESGLTPGCRALFSPSDAGSFVASIDGQVVSVVWGPYPGAYRGFELMPVLTEEDESLLAELIDFEAWMPADAWVTSAATEVVLDRWEASVSSYPSEQSPGDRLEFPEWATLEGSNPEFDSMELPDGRGISDFDCVVLTRTEATALAEAVDQASQTQESAAGPWEIYSEDLTEIYVFSLTGLVPGESGCEQLDATERPHTQTGLPAGDLSEVDACTLLPVDAAAGIIEADTASPWLSRVSFDVASRGCDFTVVDIVGGFDRRVATLALYGGSTDEQAARRLAQVVFGAGMSERELDGSPIWMNACWASAAVCPEAIAAWIDPYFIVLVFDMNVFAGTSGVSEETALALIAMIQNETAE